MSFRRKLLLVHRWSGIILAAFPVVAAATGSLLAFDHEIESAMVHELFRGERKWGEVGVSRAHLVPMIYRLHASLLLGEAGQWIAALVLATITFTGAWLWLRRARLSRRSPA